jgi:hypothetical protein
LLVDVNGVREALNHPPPGSKTPPPITAEDLVRPSAPVGNGTSQGKSGSGGIHIEGGVSQQGQINQIGPNSQATIIQKEHLALSDSAATDITEKLREFSGHNVQIFLNRETVETETFGNALAKCLVDAGIDVGDLHHITVLRAMPPGISFIVSRQNPDAQFADRLAGALADNKLAKNPTPASYGDNQILILYVTPLD